jgi:hypothetical protein
MAEVIVGEDALATVARREVRSAFNGIVVGVSALNICTENEKKQGAVAGLRLAKPS